MIAEAIRRRPEDGAAHESLGLAFAQREKRDTEPTRIPSGNLHENLDATGILRQRDAQDEGRAGLDLQVRVDAHAGEAGVDDLANPDAAVRRLKDNGPRRSHPWETAPVWAVNLSSHPGYHRTHGDLEPVNSSNRPAG